MPCWVMVGERCTWSGGQAKRLVEGVPSEVLLRADGYVAAQMENILS